MEAPNKIFAGTITEGIGVSKVWQRYPEHLENPIAYIRKDALLDWLNQRKKLMEEEIGFGLSIDDVIDKLNSM